MSILSSRVNKNNESGFTLVELLVVILIIGILAAVAIPAFMNQREKANIAALESDMKSVALTMETWLSMPENKANEMNYSVADGGWNAILRYDEDTVFPGDSVNWSLAPDLTPARPLSNVDPDGIFADTHVSEGVGIGVISRRVSLGNNYSGPYNYCLVGSVENSPYHMSQKETGVTSFKHAMYYDPIAGGLFTPEELPAGGACNGYYNRINN